MNIGIDAETLTKEKTGMGLYTQEMIKKLNEEDNENKYFLYSTKEIFLDFKLKDKFTKREKLAKKSKKSWYYSKLPKFLKEDNIEVYWGVNEVLPKRNKDTENIKFILNVYNLVSKRMKGPNKDKKRKLLNKSIKNADKIIVTSEAIKEDILDLYEISKEAVNVVYSGVDIRNNKEANKQFSEKFGIKDKPYIFFMSTIEPKKNVETLIRAFDYIKRREETNLKLIIAGKQVAKYQGILNVIENSDHKDDINMVGYVSKEEKEYLFRNAKCFVYPALHEGFGMPILEAMANECLVITSNMPAISEFGGNAAFYYNGVLNYGELGNKILEVISLPGEQKKKNIAQGLEQAKKFTWDKCGQEVLAILNNQKKGENASKPSVEKDMEEKDYVKKYKDWCENPVFDENTRKELLELKDNDLEIKERFYKDLEFGTGGLRGIIGAGTNRMNIYTVGKATQGLANYILKEKGEKKGVAIAYDSRHMSKEFSEMAALCLNANGIKTYRFESLRPTPELSFAVRELSCIAGIVVTASHNPPEYNGYKVYWEDGAQVTAPRDKDIITEVNNIKDYSQIKKIEKDEAVKSGLYNEIGKQIDDRYIEEVKKQSLNMDVVKEMADDIKIVYTPLHGTGNLPVRRVLAELGFKNVYVVPEQAEPDGDFPTVSYPNPEDPKAFELALKLAKEKDADVVLATDPDADRLGVYAKNPKTNEYVSFTGNMSALLIAEYILSERKKRNLIPENGAIVTTIVSSNMTKAIANEYGLKEIETLTGFKYIGEQIKLFEENKSYEYLFGFEESYGCLAGTHARDKDSIVAVMLLAEATAFYKKQGITLFEQMINIYEKYGYYRETLETMTLKGIEGQDKIKSIIEGLRNNTIETIGSFKVLEIRDYQNNIIKNLETGKTRETGLPKSNVLYFDLEDDAWCCVRPSGTEPKIKFYMGVKKNTMEEAEKSLEELRSSMLELCEK